MLAYRIDYRRDLAKDWTDLRILLEINALKGFIFEKSKAYDL